MRVRNPSGLRPYVAQVLETPEGTLVLSTIPGLRPMTPQDVERVLRYSR